MRSSPRGSPPRWAKAAASPKSKDSPESPHLQLIAEMENSIQAAAQGILAAQQQAAQQHSELQAAIQTAIETCAADRTLVVVSQLRKKLMDA